MSFHALVRRISPTLKRITQRLNGHHSYFDDDDLFQEALIHLWLNHKRGTLADKTDSYILQGCYFHLRNYLRKVQDKAIVLSLNTGAGGDSSRLEDVLATDGAGVFENLESSIDVEAGEAKYFTDREKTVLSLIMEGMSMREIGAKIGISHVMVLKIRNRIRDKYSQFNTESMN